MNHFVKQRKIHNKFIQIFGDFPLLYFAKLTQTDDDDDENDEVEHVVALVVFPLIDN